MGKTTSDYHKYVSNLGTINGKKVSQCLLCPKRFYDCPNTTNYWSRLATHNVHRVTKDKNLSDGKPGPSKRPDTVSVSENFFFIA